MFEDIKTETQRKKLLSSLTIQVDTREKVGKNDHILNFFDKKEISWVKKKLDFGDYAPLIPKNEELGIPEDISFADKIMVERKANLEEISKNLCQDNGRIYRELASAPLRKVLLIENASYTDLVNGKYDTKFAPKAFWAALLSMWHKYDIPIFFMPDKKYSGQFIYGYFYYYLNNVLKGNIEP